MSLVAGIISEATYVFVPESPPPPEWPEKLAEKLQGVKKSTAVVIACDSCAIDQSIDRSFTQTDDLLSRDLFRCRIIIMHPGSCRGETVLYKCRNVSA